MTSFEDIGGCLTNVRKLAVRSLFFFRKSEPVLAVPWRTSMDVR